MPPIRNVSDTALWVAIYRANETDRPNALFRDPYARRLAGERGAEIFRSMPKQDRQAWAYVTRTYLFDSFVRERVAAGAQLVINLAAGLDARPYRMELPPDLEWVDIDLPEITEYKADLLASDKPRCRLERIALDLADVNARRDVFARLAARGKRALIVSEGLLIYLGDDGARGLALDLAAHTNFREWVFDIASPGLRDMIRKQVGDKLDAANATLKFAPPEGPWFFEQAGWRIADVRGTLRHAAKLMKLPLFLRFFNLFPENPRAGKGIWAGTCLASNAHGEDLAETRQRQL